MIRLSNGRRFEREASIIAARLGTLLRVEDSPLIPWSLYVRVEHDKSLALRERPGERNVSVDRTSLLGGMTPKEWCPGVTRSSRLLTS
jgi:hypothetical protein